MIYADRYFLWKDPECKGINPEWIEISKDEYIAFINVEDKHQRRINRRRRFEITEDDWDGNRTSAFEVTLKRYREWDAEKHREAYKKQIEEEEGITFVSLDAPMYNDDGEDFTLYDIIPSDYGEDHTYDELIEKLYEALDTLTPEERRITDLLYLENHEKKSERQIARELGVPDMTLNSRKQRILEKLRFFFVQN